MPNRTDGPNTPLGGTVTLVEIKSKFDAEFRRFSIDRIQMPQFSQFYELVCRLHRLEDCETTLTYSDRDGELLPINNDSNLAHALSRASLLRLVVQRKGEDISNLNMGKSTVPLLGKLIPPKQSRPRVDIGQPVSFRPVSAIIDVDIVPATHMRVKLMKNGSDRPLGFYIRDGVSLRVTQSGVEKVPGIFISRLVPGGLAQHTGLLSVGDEVLEVNGIDVGDKTLDQVTDMMIANANNLIITVKPANQQLTLAAGKRTGTNYKKGSKALASSTSQSQSSSIARSAASANDLRASAISNEIANGSPAVSNGSNRTGGSRHKESKFPVVNVEEDPDSDDSDLEADEVHVHEPAEEERDEDVADVECHNAVQVQSSDSEDEDISSSNGTDRALKDAVLRI